MGKGVRLRGCQTPGQNYGFDYEIINWLVSLHLNIWLWDQSDIKRGGGVRSRYPLCWKEDEYAYKTKNDLDISFTPLVINTVALHLDLKIFVPNPLFRV